MVDPVLPFEDLSGPSKNASQAPTKPAIRTMRSDIERFFKTTKPSIAELVGKTNTQRGSFPARTWSVSRWIMFGGIGLILLATLTAGAVYFLPLWGGNKELPKLIPPAPFFATETSRTISVALENRGQFLGLMNDAFRELEREGTMKRILIKVEDGPELRFSTLNDFFSLYRITPPAQIYEYTASLPMFYVAYGSDGSRFGLAVKTNSPERTFAAMLSWETALIRDLRPLFFGEEPEIVLGPFEDRTYRNVDWRFLKLSQNKDFGIAYTIFPAGNILVITTAKGVMEQVIDRLFEAK